MNRVARGRREKVCEKKKTYEIVLGDDGARARARASAGAGTGAGTSAGAGAGVRACGYGYVGHSRIRWEGVGERF